MRTLRLAPRAIALCGALFAAVQAGATGYWNVPSTFCQCMGYGWGAGYHAPLVLGPIQCAGWCDHKEVRLPYAPSPPAICYGDTSWEFHSGQTTRLESTVEPAPAAEYLPPPQPPAAIFGPPID